MAGRGAGVGNVEGRAEWARANRQSCLAKKFDDVNLGGNLCSQRLLRQELAGEAAVVVHGARPRSASLVAVVSCVLRLGRVRVVMNVPVGVEATVTVEVTVRMRSGLRVAGAVCNVAEPAGGVVVVQSGRSSRRRQVGGRHDRVGELETGAGHGRTWQ